MVIIQVRIAETKAIPNFVSGIMNELRAGPAFPDLFRITLLQSEASGRHLEDLTFAQGVVNSLTQVHSFDMTSNQIDVSVSGAFLPTYASTVYGAKDALVISGEGWHYDHTVGTSKQSTHFLGVGLGGATSKPLAVGKVDGYVLNTRSMDVQDNVLRVATTIRNWWYHECTDSHVDASWMS